MTKSSSTSSTTMDSSSSSSNNTAFVFRSIAAVLLLQFLYVICKEAYEIRTYAIKEFGRVIHEFDPYFNYRATEYLYANGWYKFRTWFDYKVWYPLGRPVGTTIYPGMQVTAVFIKNHILKNWSINDICVFIPCWFGVTATLAVCFLTMSCVYDHTGSEYTSALQDVPGIKQFYTYIVLPIINIVFNFMDQYIGTTFGLRPKKGTANNNWLTALCCGVASAAIMSVVPAHLLRSIGGGYDNESVAMTAMVFTFGCWTYTLRKRTNHTVTILWGCITGLAYFNMVAAWGGYVFVLNLIGIHASALVITGRYTQQLHRAYTAFFLVGTICAIQVPVVGYAPIRSLEQMGPLVAFGGIQLIELCEILIRQKRQQNKNKEVTMKQAWMIRLQVFGAVGFVGAVIGYILWTQGYFGPISSRVRGLFVKHTKTGNPLVDSVAEHQAASTQAYFQYLQNVVYLAPIGLTVTTLFYWNDSSSFLIVYAITAYFLSHKMVRLILLTAPIASVLGGIVLGRVVAWAIGGAVELLELVPASFAPKPPTTTATTTTKEDDTTDTTNGSKADKKGKLNKSNSTTTSDNKKEVTATTKKTPVNPFIPIVILLIRLGGCMYLVKQARPYGESFYRNGHEMAKAVSHPTIIQKGRMQSGEEVVIDDYREAYNWLRHNTPEDARIMAWWDYGYQITGISDRTTIADGNTWNHEHIALLGRILTAPEKDAHRIARHLADYVLVWAGGGGDDVAKSPHLRRIANSVYRGLCREPTCRDFGFYSDRTPTESMRHSLLFTLHSHRMQEGIQADPNRFREVYTSKYGKVRIFKIQSVSQESKEWVANPANRLCDAPGSWFCPGQYPPALEKILASKKDFQQLEDFNKDGGDDEYVKQYFENLNKKDAKPPPENKKPKVKLTPELIENINSKHENTEITSALYGLISADDFDGLRKVLKANPEFAHVRSADGRGPMWWAHEMGRAKMVELLKKFKVSETRHDRSGATPLTISTIEQ